jgi:predicted nucleic acid-binding protein
MAERGMLADASALIYLAKADLLGAACQIVGAVRVVPAVWGEAIESGLSRRLPDAARLEQAAAEGLLRRVPLAMAPLRLAAEIGKQFRLGSGESQVFAMAKRGESILMDDGRAVRVALSLGLIPVSTLMLPALGVRRGAVDEGFARQMLRVLATVVAVRADTLAQLESRISEER